MPLSQVYQDIELPPEVAESDQPEYAAEQRYVAQSRRRRRRGASPM